MARRCTACRNTFHTLFKIKEIAGPAMRRNVLAFLAELTALEHLELAALLEAGERVIAKDLAEDHGYPRGVVSYLTVTGDGRSLLE